MTSVTMLNDAMTGTTARRRLNNTLIEYFLRHSVTAAAKAGRLAKPVIAALKRCATRNLAPVFVSVIATVIPMTTVVAPLLCLLSVSVPGQTQNQTQAQMRQQLLRDLDS